MHHLLIVDDQPDLADDLAAMLPWHTVGIGTVHRAYSAPEALEIVMQHPIDIVITDIRMPGMSGLDLIEHIRMSWKKIRCILLSGYDDFEYARRAMKSRVNDCLLKPVEDRELLDAVSRAVKDIEEQWKEISSLSNALRSVKRNLPILRSHLLMDMLDGRRMDDFGERIELFELPVVPSKPVCLLLLRLEGGFDRLDRPDASLMHFAVSNIAEEIFGDMFHLWQAKDRYGYLVLLIQPKAGRTADEEEAGKSVEMKALQVQHNIKRYLNGTVSVLISNWGTMPGDIRGIYEQAVAHFRQHIGGEREFLLKVGTGPGKETKNKRAANTVTHLYEPPLLVHLLESGQWSALEDKLEAIFDELETNWSRSHEHILEAYFVIAGSLLASIHKNKLWLADILQDDFRRLAGGPQFHTILQLREWTERTVAKIRKAMEAETRDSRSFIVKKVQEYVQRNLREASLQSIAAHVYLNPSYLSKLYKMETGEGISDFLFRMKMEQAVHRLQHTNEKIYEIAESLGYAKTSYFIKLFKDKYGMTPQEYRDRLS